FSEYAEGSNENRYLEIYNPTNETIDLTNYGFPSVGNSPTNVGEYEYWNDFPTNATIAPNQVYMIAHPDADATILNQADMTHQYLSNGNDGYALVFGNESNYYIVDWLGDWNGDPGDGWDVAGVENGTLNHTLVRKPHVLSGNLSWTSSAGTNTDNSEWTVYEQDTWDYLGFHAIDILKTNQTTFPLEFRLLNIFPNPFNPTTTIKYSVETRQIMSLRIYDITGQLRETLIDGFIESGSHTIQWNASNQPNGIYFVRLQVQGHSQNQKIILLK
ncbi:MAG: T9SS type A sorting domain-containing protein, partial [Candidatus Marinimicrobia bacterium]|nr:T9SS type A sorting domain-containing protein [Candidatus Neomarinimicrobiota bacterium]MBT4144620.1 T9SS type A sorting domain-containing protein [Candidatus Neomarinimicrobiota bacterium]MBT4178073.1 T9SS type A sorting domain-containing protein [Candidatus Neomarinimicrobiota bacterium]MBT4593985.1 T9SS type A sorting domain-containing protein [Candidatus Neomarinimicrobiota bacterium]MBT4991181.1 T9SS type A sorting domain-containing protein [Candidatus Neomarinimicrobiota bacterium]